MNYEKADKWSKHYGETNDCSVKAVSIACDVPYKLAKDTLSEVGTRKARQGTNLLSIKATIASLGYTATEIEGDGVLFGGTVGTLLRKLPSKGRYIALVRNHVLAVQNGKIEDWTEGRRHRIVKVYKVERTVRKPRHKHSKA